MYTAPARQEKTVPTNFDIIQEHFLVPVEAAG